MPVNGTVPSTALTIFRCWFRYGVRGNGSSPTPPTQVVDSARPIQVAGSARRIRVPVSGSWIRVPDSTTLFDQQDRPPAIEHFHQNEHQRCVKRYLCEFVLDLLIWIVFCIFRSIENLISHQIDHLIRPANSATWIRPTDSATWIRLLGSATWIRALDSGSWIRPSKCVHAALVTAFPK